MKEATIFRQRSEDPFCRIPNETLHDPNLSFKAKGILAYLLSKPDGWKPRVQDLVNNSADGESAVMSGLMELRVSNYAELRKHYEGGKIKGWRLVVADSRVFKSAGKAVTEKLEVENLVLGNLDVENRVRTKNELVQKRNGIKKESAAVASATSEAGPANVSIAGKRGGPPGFREFIGGWMSAYAERFGERYVMTPRDGMRLKALLGEQALSPESVLRMAQAAWDNDGWNCQNRADTIHGLCEAFSDIQAELRQSRGRNDTGESAQIERQIQALHDEYDDPNRQRDGMVIRREIAQLKAKLKN